MKQGSKCVGVIFSVFFFLFWSVGFANDRQIILVDATLEHRKLYLITNRSTGTGDNRTGSILSLDSQGQLNTEFNQNGVVHILEAELDSISVQGDRIAVGGKKPGGYFIAVYSLQGERLHHKSFEKKAFLPEGTANVTITNRMIQLTEEGSIIHAVSFRHARGMDIAVCKLTDALEKDGSFHKGQPMWITAESAGEGKDRLSLQSIQIGEQGALLLVETSSSDKPSDRGYALFRVASSWESSVVVQKFEVDLLDQSGKRKLYGLADKNESLVAWIEFEAWRGMLWTGLTTQWEGAQVFCDSTFCRQNPSRIIVSGDPQGHHTILELTDDQWIKINELSNIGGVQIHSVHRISLEDVLSRTLNCTEALVEYSVISN